MLAEIITIGDEILIGQIVDTNSAFIAKELNKIGVSVHQITSIQDNKKQILQALAEANASVDIVIITGGLGPTKDDITKHTLCEFFEDNLVEDADTLQHVKDLFASFGKGEITEINRKQALVPSKATVLRNAIGTAPGMWIKNEKTVFVSLPGVPSEMKRLITNEVVPQIITQFNRPHILHKTFLTYGLGESALSEKIEDWENALPNFISLAYLPQMGKVRLRLTAKGADLDTLKNAIEDESKRLYELIGDIIFGVEGEETLEEVVAKLFTEKKKSLAVAESCTGGKIAGKITAMPGASVYFKGGVVSYETQTKIDVLGVSEETVKTDSVVSEAVAEQMALGVKKVMKSDYAIATTGNAGPLKGDSNVEVGTVCIAIATPDKVYSEKFAMGNFRNMVVQRAVNKAFEMIQKEISKL